MPEASDNDPHVDASHGTKAAEQQTGPVTQGSSIRWKNVILTAVTIVLVGGIATGIAWYVITTEPALHPVKGFVFLDGEPMAGGAVLSYYTEDWSGALAAIGDDGRFEFTTNGEQGAYEGSHAITFTLTAQGFPPESLLPGKYVDPANPPFTLDVNARTQDEDVRFELFSEGGQKGRSAAEADAVPVDGSGDENQEAPVGVDTESSSVESNIGER